MPELITRDAARERGLVRFFTGKPCKRGHLAARFVSTGQCPECIRDWTKKNPHRIWYVSHPKENVAKVRAWRRKNPDKKRVQAENRRARLKNAEGTHAAADIEWLIQKQKGKCAHSWCRRPLARGRTIDHLIPLALGGRNDRSNLQLLCTSCNASKKNRHPIDHAQRNGYLL